MAEAASAPSFSETRRQRLSKFIRSRVSSVLTWCNFAQLDVKKRECACMFFFSQGFSATLGHLPESVMGLRENAQRSIMLEVVS